MNGNDTTLDQFKKPSPSTTNCNQATSIVTAGVSLNHQSELSFAYVIRALDENESPKLSAEQAEQLYILCRQAIKDVFSNFLATPQSPSDKT